MIILGLVGYFATGGSLTFVMGLGRVPIIPPGPAMVLMDRKEIN